MAGLTEQEKQARYQSDVDKINGIADEKIRKLTEVKAAHDSKEQAAVDKLIAVKQAVRDKRKAGIKAAWDRKLASVKPGQEWKKPVIDEEYDGLSDLADVEYEEWFDYSAEQQYKKDGRARERYAKAIESVEKWRIAQIAKESAQLAAGTQRQRK
ncbi:MAG: hypothetical protein KJ954_13920 [Alphaproteobacteria bacterium]|nr:hypothetical protein [Alphaproteobacteria bacterium]